VSKNSGVQRPNTDTLSWVHPWRATADDGIPRGGTECSLGRWGASWILLHTIDLVIRVRKAQRQQQLDLEGSAGWASASSRGLWVGHAPGCPWRALTRAALSPPQQLLQGVTKQFVESGARERASDPVDSPRTEHYKSRVDGGGFHSSFYDRAPRAAVQPQEQQVCAWNPAAAANPNPVL
jgi:hypothetical protein